MVPKEGWNFCEKGTLVLLYLRTVHQLGTHFYSTAQPHDVEIYLLEVAYLFDIVQMELLVYVFLYSLLANRQKRKKDNDKPLNKVVSKKAYPSKKIIYNILFLSTLRKINII